MHTYWLWLALRQDLTDYEKNTLLKYYRDPEDLYYADPEEAPQELTDLVCRALEDRKLDTAHKTARDCANKDLRILTQSDREYPARLKNIPDPPVVLYCRGRLPKLDEVPAIGVVGTRKASAYGLSMARQLGYQLARCGAVVVSGMALGVDAMAMGGALAADGCVIGVLGCGAEQIYPKANTELFRDTLRYGCILSEFPPGTPPLKWNFPKRNRIISGLSCGIAVVEAPEKSGSLITARQAAEQGRDVFVVPGNVDMPGFAGSFRLLQEGAAPVRSGWELLREYEHLYPGVIRRDDAPAPEAAPKPAKKTAAEEKKSEIQAQSQKKPIDKEPSGPYIDLNSILPKLSEDERAIVSALRDGPRQADDVIAETGMTTGKMLAAMTMLELKGILRRLGGKRIQLN